MKKVRAKHNALQALQYAQLEVPQLLLTHALLLFFSFLVDVLIAILRRLQELFSFIIFTTFFVGFLHQLVNGQLREVTSLLP